MKIALVLTQDRGGPVDLTVALASELSRRPGGPDITVIGPEPVTSAGHIGDLLRPVTVSSKTDRRGAVALRRTLEEVAPDVVHAQDRRATLLAATIARRRAPVVTTFHGIPDVAAGRWIAEGPVHERAGGLEATIRLAADAAVCALTRRIVAPSHSLGRFLHDGMHLPTPRISVIHNGVAETAPRPPAGPVRVFTSVGSFAALKAMPALVRAFAEVAASRPHLRLRLVGDGDERSRCEQEATALGVADRIDFTGYRKDIPEQLARADGFVLPSWNENMPLSLLEAMMAAKACIASRVGGIPEALDSDCGLLVAPGDQAGLVAAMARLADDGDLARRLGSAAASRARQQFTIAECADRYLELWRDVAGETAVQPSASG